ncbi:uncharacterized protein JCM15063_002712 [Sporobolomyces koalae]|uniref:uncharacterized protein n=1 Tax=Sporobolomyces koalae TaxID=500713 RepID=UPI00317E0253
MIFSAALIAAVAATLATTDASAVPRTKRWATPCAELWATAPELLQNLEVYVAQDYPAGTNFTSADWGQYGSPAYPTPVPNLPDFCRFGAYIHTSNESKVQFEVWLPTKEAWNDRFMMVGNGGVAGGVNFLDMGVPITKYGFAVASTNAGHIGTSGNGTFALNNPETQIDFGYRAVELTTTYSKALVKAYYGKAHKTAIWNGCSSGGKQGLKAIQHNPDSYDGVIAGAAAQWWTHLNAQTWRINAIVNALNSSAHLNASDYAVIGAEVLRQCDELDGVKDNVITNPYVCRPELSVLACDQPFANQSSCLSYEKINTMQTIWADYHSVTTGEFLFPGFAPGSEGLAAFSVNGVPYGPGPDFFYYQVQNQTTVGNFNVTDQIEFERLIKIADETDPGQTNAIDGDISPFLKRGKLITYVGLADTLIPTGSTLWYYEHVRKTLGYPSNLGDAYRLFTVPGMGHCSGGPGAYNFGAASQKPLALGGTGQSSTFDKEHDMVLALLDWVENGNAPNELISSSYTGGNKTNGVAFQRKLCPYPQEGVYIGGDANSADSYECTVRSFY